MNALLEVETEEETNVLALPIKSRTRAAWQKLDLSSVIRAAEAGGSDWKIHLKFQEESSDGAASSVKLLRPSSVLRLSEKPFLVIFYEDNEAEEAEEVSGQTEVRRRKRSVKVGPDLRNFYGHDELNQIEPEIITIDHSDHSDHSDRTAGNHKDHTTVEPEKKKKTRKSDINDIDSEDELILDYETDDLSEAEADRHRFNIEEKQDLIPYPEWWSVKKRNRKRNHHKRF